MSAAIYQRARPVRWDEVVGQEHVKDVLRPALERGRVGHAYLFSGPRGVGKTTTARLIAMSVNCEAPDGVARPCGECEPCRAVVLGRHPDVLEIDAASNNSVDDVRDLRDKVALQPMRGTRKVFILDEAHMMSRSAFNALLKTLEEPPEHAVFVLATTEPEKLPATILSRCQHYRFRRLSADEIAGKLATLAAREGATAEPAALRLLARAADGAMRDGESLLERLLAAGEPVVTAASVEAALGLPPQERIEALALALAAGDAAAVFSSLGRLYEDGFAPRTVTERTKVAVRDLLHDGLGLGGSEPREPRLPTSKALRLIRALDEEDARFARAGDLVSLETAFVRALLAGSEGAARTEDTLPAEESASPREAVAAARAPAPPAFDPTTRAARPAVGRATADPAPGPAAVAAVPAAAAGSAGRSWGDLITAANRSDKSLAAFLRGGQGQLDGGTLVIAFGAKQGFHADQVAKRLADVIALAASVFGGGTAVELRMPDGSKKNSSVPNRPLPAAAVAREALEAARPAVGAPAVEPAEDEPPEPEPPEPEPPEHEPPPAARPGLALVPIEEGEVASSGRIFEPDGGDLFGTTVALHDKPSIAVHEPPAAREPEEPEPVAPDSREPGDALETLDVQTVGIAGLADLEDAAPLEAYDLDLDAPDDLAASAQRPVARPLQGHPTYATLTRLFPHRLREAGRLAPDAAAAEPAAASPDAVLLADADGAPAAEEGDTA